MLDLAEFAALVAEFRRKGTDLARSPGRQILAVRFALRGVGLALGGDKQRTQAAGGGAAYFALHGRDSSGRLHKLGASTPGGGGEPSPRWEPLEVAAAARTLAPTLTLTVTPTLTPTPTPTLPLPLRPTPTPTPTLTPNPNPTANPHHTQVATAALGSCRQLRVEVWEGAISRNLGSELAQSRASFGASSGQP